MIVNSTGGNEWLFASIFDYFEYRNDAIYTYSEQIASLDVELQSIVFQGIRNRIIDMVLFYTEKQNLDLSEFVCPLVNDLYRTLNGAYYYSEAQSTYLQNTAKLFFTQLNKLGYSIHFGTNNVFGNPISVTKLFPVFLDDCGFKQYDAFTATSSICIRSHESIKDLNASYSAHKKEVLELINSQVEKANHRKENYFIILPDCGGNCFDEMLKTMTIPGNLNFFKSEEPDSSKVHIFQYKKI